MNIQTPAQLASYLETQGYAPHVSQKSVLLPLSGAEGSTVAAFTFEADHIAIHCRLAVLGDFSEASLPALCLAALDANTQIAPYAFAVIGASDADAGLEQCPLVLTDTLPKGDLSEQEVSYALDKLLEAVAHSREVLQNVSAYSAA
ncbi:MAG: hypothetical protein RLZZ244_1137 [Verrucomicrobiota bacterium]|jgi:hypothetical protein